MNLFNYSYFPLGSNVLFIKPEQISFIENVIFNK